MQISRLRQVMLVAGELEEQVAFFEKTLGLEQQFRDGDRWVQFSAGDVSFALPSPGEGMGAEPGSILPVFEVDDLDAARGELIAAGHTCGDLRDMGAHGRTLLASGPAGARVVLFQRAG